MKFKLLLLICVIASSCQDKYLLNKQYVLGKSSYSNMTSSRMGVVTMLHPINYDSQESFLCDSKELEGIAYNSKIYFRLKKANKMVYATDVMKATQNEPTSTVEEGLYGSFIIHSIFDHPLSSAHNKYHIFTRTPQAPVDQYKKISFTKFGTSTIETAYIDTTIFYLPMLISSDYKEGLYIDIDTISINNSPNTYPVIKSINTYHLHEGH